MPMTVETSADVEVEGAFSLVFVVSNTFFMLTTQEDQLRCFENVRVPPGRARCLSNPCLRSRLVYVR